MRRKSAAAFGEPGGAQFHIDALAFVEPWKVWQERVATVQSGEKVLQDCDIVPVGGFGDLSCFNRAFRRRNDVTPSDTRNARWKHKGLAG